MASSDGIDDADLPTKPLPTDGPVAAHVPVSDLPTAPLVAQDEGFAPAASGATPPTGGPAPRNWVWAIVAVVLVAAIAAIITGLTLGNRGPNPSLVPSISSLTPSTSAPSSSRAQTGVGSKQSAPAPQPSTQPTQPSAPPPTTAPPGPTVTPSP